MNEVRRMAYLQALGVDSYVSRWQLPGAAVTRRVVRTAGPVASGSADPSESPEERPMLAAAARRGAGTRSVVDARADSVISMAPEPEPVPHGAAVPRFSLSVIVAGEWLWLEDLDGMPLTTEQVELVQAMARALSQARGSDNDPPQRAALLEKCRADVARFDWPMHTNRQLDMGEDAARVSVAAFVSRRLEAHGCSGLVILGQACATRLPVQLTNVFTVRTVSSAEMLASPALKKQAWVDLLALVRKQ